jgi:serralysin
MAAGSKTISLSGNDDIDALLQNNSADFTAPIIWDTGTLTYSFPTSASVYSYSGEPDTFAAIVQDDTALVDAIPVALKLFSQYANLTFTETTGSADLRFAEADLTGEGRGYFPGDDAAQSGDVWFDPGDSSRFYLDGKDFSAVMHEIGHALGLSHPGLEMDPSHVGWDYTIMSYQSFPNAPSILSGNAPQTPMLADVAALQYMYGANFNTNAGDSVYTWSALNGQMFINGKIQNTILLPEDNKIYMTLWDGGGIDTYDFSNYTSNVKVDLRPGEWSSPSPEQIAVLSGFGDPVVLARGSIANAFLYNGDTRSLIENAVGGSGNDTLIGNQGNNVLTGNDGDDTFFYTSGSDTFNGGRMATAGDTANFIMSFTGVVIVPVVSTTTIRLANGKTSTFVVNDGSPLADDLGNAYDVSYGTKVGSIHLVDLHGIENITGSPFADIITGNRGDNVISTLGGDDYVFYTGGFDTITGGSGSDTIDFSQFGFAVLVTLTAAANGAEAFTSDSSTISFGAPIRPIAELALFNNLVGSGFDDVLGGTAGNNTLDGRAGNDILSYTGGLDVLNGNTGTDMADFSGMTSAVFVDLAGGGREAKSNGTTNASTGSLADIADLAAIENLTGTDFIDVLRGDGNPNVINGGGGNDILGGRGGDDTVNGGAGDDTYEFVESGLDRFFDQSGTDKIVISDINRVTGAARVGDDLIVKFSASSFRIVDHFAGHPIENLLDATHGVVLATSTVGGNASGIIAGTDRNDLLDGRGGDDLLYGNEGNDDLLGGSGNDLIDGGAGNDVLNGESGDDTMIGGLGRDVFVVAPTFADGGSCGNDVIVDFSPGLSLPGHAASHQGGWVGGGGYAIDAPALPSAGKALDPNGDVIDLTAFDTSFRALDANRDRVLGDGDGDGHISVQIEGNDTVLSFAEGSIRIADIVNLHVNDFLF